jgi:hypothetical protein
MTLTSLAEFSKFAVREYLQTAVFIDDNIYTLDTARPASPSEIAVRELQPIFVEEGIVDERRSEDEKEAALPERPPFRTKDLVGSFAEYGIVCALYEPEPDFSTGEESVVFKLCETADLVILDWDFHEVGVEGTKPKSLIENLIKSGNSVAPHHMRLMVIYTNTLNLHFVSNSIYEHLRGRGYNPEPVGTSGFRLRAGSSRILVLGKDGIRRAADQESFTIKESKLAERLLQEFSDMNAGILPSYALHGLAAIRRNSKRILDRFHGDMNGAFLLHRALSMESEDVFDQLPALLSEELLAVLEDTSLDAASVSAIASNAVDLLQVRSAPITWHYPGGKQFPLANDGIEETVLKELLAKGRIDRRNHPDIHQLEGLPDSGFRGINSNLMRDFLAMVDTKDIKSNEQLALLFNSRTQYRETTRNLYYGTIIRRREVMIDGSSWVYSFCMMPICDCIRLDQTAQCQAEKAIQFPFWELRDDVFSPSEVSRRGLVVKLPNGSYKILSAGGKSRDRFWVHGFQANKSTGTVTATRNEHGQYMFLSNETLEIEWIGELKSLHSQRIAHDIGQSLSRVGLVEAEWLRLLCDR